MKNSRPCRRGSSEVVSMSEWRDKETGQLIFKDGKIIYRNEITMKTLIKFICALGTGLVTAGFVAWSVAKLFGNL